MGILSAFRFAFQNLFFTPILYGVIASLAVFSTVWDKGDRFKDQLTDRFRSQDDTFDFVIVGGGTAGAVLANRLSQHHTVLLLEAGGESHPFQAIPGLSLFLSKQPGTDWLLKSQPQTKSCYACRHKKYFFSQGKNLGGSGNLNYLIHLRGNPLDFDNWATITGDPSWSYDEVLKYFIKSEHFVGETTDKSAHGYGGPLQIQIPDYTGLAEEWNLAGVEMGYLHIDLNGRHVEGFDTVFYPVKNGVRQATYRSYIQPVRNRPSLLIRKFAHVNKIMIREGTNDAYGVEYDRHGHRKFAFANKEVILSAGALQSPKILTLSGVGQLEHLDALHIPVKSVLPVGKNLQDHFSTLLGPFYINKPKTISFDRDIDKKSFISFATNGKGPLTTTGFQATALLASGLAKSEGQAGWPDLQLTLFGLTPHRMFYSDIGHAFGIREDILHKYYGDATGKENAFFIMVTVARPLSKGDLCLPSKDPYKPAVITPSYINDPDDHDLKVLTEGIHRALYLAENTTVFKDLETVYTEKCFPGCENVPFRSDTYWECYLRSFSIANNDHAGTCAMGKVGSPYAVVDPELQVQGTQRLRVVDASVMPTIVGAPTQAATIMIAEKGAALILDKWKDEAKTLYGPPGKEPGPVITQYGPPGKTPGKEPGLQYGPPGKEPGPAYGPPGKEPGPAYGPPGKEPGLAFGTPGKEPGPQYGPPEKEPGPQYGPPGKEPGPVYGPPGKEPGPAYGPPGKEPGPPYGSPVKPTDGKDISSQYGPPGISPAPVKGGDGFENYDSFSVIRHQLDPNSGGGSLGAPGSTALIPIQPDLQLWASPSPFPNLATVAPVIIPNDIFIPVTTPESLFTPEPSQMLLPPGEQIGSTPESYSYATSTFDFGGSVSTTANYATYDNLDASRSEKTYIASEADRVDEQGSGSNGTRQGKSFYDGNVPQVPDGNQLGQGTDEGGRIFPSSTPASVLFTSSPTPSQSPYKEIRDIINDGQDFRVVRKRIRTTPRVFVHHRGHLGHQNVNQHVRKDLSESLEKLFLTTSSVRPVPKEIVTIRKRRPVPFRRFRAKTTVAPIAADESLIDNVEATVYPNDLGATFEYTTPTPAEETPEVKIPPPPINGGGKRLRSRVPGGRRRYVRKKYSRPMNFSGNRINPHQITAESATSTSVVSVKSSSTIYRRVQPTDNNEQQDELEERADLASLEDSTELPALEDEEEYAENGAQNNNFPKPDKPVVVFKNIELEQSQELKRKARSGTQSIENLDTKSSAENGGRKNLLTEESRNPIMVVDLNPAPEIIDPKADKDNDTVAIPMKDEYTDDLDKENNTGDKESQSGITYEDEYYYDDSSSNNTDSSRKLKDEVENNESTLSAQENSQQEGEVYEDTSSFRISVRSSSSKNSTEAGLNSPNAKSSSTSTNKYENFKDEPKTSAVATSTSTTVHPRLMFRIRNKLIRNHS